MTVRGKSSPLSRFFVQEFFHRGKKLCLSFQMALPSLPRTPSFMGQEHVFKHVLHFYHMLKCHWLLNLSSECGCLALVGAEAAWVWPELLQILPRASHHYILCGLGIEEADSLCTCFELVLVWHRILWDALMRSSKEQMGWKLPSLSKGSCICFL